TRNKERKYASSLTKTKDARYDLVGIEEMIPRLWSTFKEAYDKNAELGIHHWGPKRQLFYRSRNNARSRHEVFSRLKILSVIRISVDKQFGYGYLNEIVVRRADQKEYTFREADFERLHLNDIEDMFLLYVQHKLHNLTDDEIVDLMIALRMFTRSIFIKRRVEDVQLGNKSNQKRLMQAYKLYKFCDRTLKSVREILNVRLHNFVLGYNADIPKRAWTYKDQTQTDDMLMLIDNMLLERRIMQSLECFVGGRTVETDYRLLTQTE
ncbi:hypothetical protein Tco_1478881, partial [Tanacetum coccineum]